MRRMNKSQRTQSQRPNTSRNETRAVVAEDLNEYVSKCVRYFIYRSGSNEPIKKSELKHNVLPGAGKKFDAIIQGVARELDKVYGFKLVPCDDVGYITVQNVDAETDNTIEEEQNENDEVEVPEDINKVLVMLVLTHIYMSKNAVNEASLYTFLNAAGIDYDSNNGIFGKVKDFINITMVKQGYLVRETDPLMRENTYIWGDRAENTVSKLKILNFVSKTYGDKQPSSWVSQFEEANKQFDTENANGQIVLE